jgi:predicted ATPase
LFVGCLYSPVVNWRDHVHKMHVMRVAWSGLLLHTPEELLRGGVSAFKANWREEQLHRRLLSAAVMGWKGLVDKNQAVTAVRNRIKDVSRVFAAICLD